MTDRILLGTRTSDGRSGLFVSRPGADVQTCPASDLLIDPDTTTTRIVWQQSYDLPAFANTATGGGEDLWRVNHPDFGITPYAIIEVTAGFDRPTTGTDALQPNFYEWIFEADATSFILERYKSSGVHPPVSFIVRLLLFADTVPLAFPRAGGATYPVHDL